MMYSEFIGMIKLVSGEEVIGSVLVCEEENGFVVETPFSIDETIIETPGGEMVKVDLRPWIKFSSEEIIFTGDSLMVLGCGRIFEGTPNQMFESFRLCLYR